jgi:hypothetical protein
MSESTICIRRMQLDDVDQVHTVDRLSFNHPWPRRSYIFDLQMPISGWRKLNTPMERQLLWGCWCYGW